MSINPKIPLWAKISAVSFVVVIICNFFGISAGKSLIYSGLLFLVLTLIPVHFKKLVRYRRDFGIVSGILIVLHGIIAFNTLMNASFEKLFHQVIVNGYIATIIIVVLLITSNYAIQRKIGNKWRVIHAFIWFSLPLSLLHALMASRYYTGELPTLAFIIMGGLGIFGIGKIILPKSNLKENIRDALLIVLGVIFAIGIALLYPTGKHVTSNLTSPAEAISITPSEVTDFPADIPYAESTSAPTIPPTASSQGFSMQDVTQHSTQSDCYVAYQGTVYNITSYLPNHPGGAQKAERMCGQKIDTFSDQHSGGSFSSPQAQEMLVPLEVGKLR